MQAASAIQLRVQDRVAIVTLNRPECANALRPADLHGLAELLDRIGGGADADLVMLTGAGARHFCAGLDLRMPQLIAEDLSGDGPTGLGAAVRAAGRCPLLIIGRINGACVAGGMGLLAACDIVIATDTAHFSLPEIQAGQIPLVVVAALTHCLPPAVLADLALGMPLSAERAAQIGLIAAAVPASRLDEEIGRRISILAALPPAARQVLVRQLRESRLCSTEHHLSSAEAAARRIANQGGIAPCPH